MTFCTMWSHWAELNLSIHKPVTCKNLNLSSCGCFLVPAVVAKGPSSLNVNIGDHVVLQCGVMGDPVPKIR